MKFPRLSYVAGSLGLGAFTVLAMQPWSWWPCLAGLGLFYVLFTHAQDRSPRTRGRLFFSGFLGWCFGFGYFVAGLWWIANALLVPGNPFRWVWPLSIAGLPALLAFFPACACLCSAWFGRQRRLSGFLFFIAAMGLSEWARGHFFSGLPWNSYGYSWTGWLAIAQTAAVGGTFLLSLLSIGWAVLPGFLYVGRTGRGRKAGLAAAGGLSFALCLAYGQHRLATAQSGTYEGLAVKAVQANIAQADKWDPAKEGTNLRRLIELSAPGAHEVQAPVTIIVWPETSLQQDELANPVVRDALRVMLARYAGQAYLMTGLLRWVDRPRGEEELNFNSFAVYDKELRQLTAYDKSHLVPFGEYIPLQDILKMKPFVAFGGFTAGRGPATFTLPHVPSFGPLICYEIIFPGAVTARRGVKPEWLVNVTNDAWYGDSPGPRQHFAQTRFRAIEEGVPVVRAATTGISGVIDPLGRVVYETALDSEDARSSALPRPLPERTIYARYGDSVFFLLTGFLLLAAACLRRRG